jgi:hypothetical protein
MVNLINKYVRLDDEFNLEIFINLCEELDIETSFGSSFPIREYLSAFDFAGWDFLYVSWETRSYPSKWVVKGSSDIIILDGLEEFSLFGDEPDYD